jgi:hypothetical protein
MATQKRTATSILPSGILRLISYASFTQPHLLNPFTVPVAGVVAPVLYLVSLPGLLHGVRRKRIVEEREVVQMISGGGKKRRAIEKRAGVQMMNMKKDRYIRREGEVSLGSKEDQAMS